MKIEELKNKCTSILNVAKKEVRELTESERAEIDEIKKEIKSLREMQNKQDEECEGCKDEEEIASESTSTSADTSASTSADTSSENVEQKKCNKRNNVTIVANEEKKEIKMNEKKEFRLLKAINKIANNRQLDEAEMNVVNSGIEEMRKAGVNYSGQIVLPTNIEERGEIQATVAGHGIENVATDVTPILEPLRAKNVLVQAGAKYMTGLIGDVQVPVMGASNVLWEGETASAEDGAGSFSSVKLQPKRLTAYVDISKQFLAQDSNDAEAVIKADIVNAINSKLESTILGIGTGTTTQPAGIFAAAPTTSTTDFKGLCDIEASVEDANIMGTPVYVMSNKAKAVFRNMNKSAKTTQLVYEAGEIDGTKVYNTSNVPANYFAFGDFSNLAIGQWGAIDLTVDPYTRAADGMIRLVVNGYFDAKVLRSNAIATGKNA